MAEWANRISDVERQSYDNMTLLGLLKLKVYRRATGEATILVLVTSRHALPNSDGRPMPRSVGTRHTFLRGFPGHASGAALHCNVRY